MMRSTQNSAVLLLVTASLSLLFSSCARQVRPEQSHLQHRFDKGKTLYYSPVTRQASAPPRAPKAVKRMVAAANSLIGKPYKYGGGHARFQDSGYDCSGAVSYVLRAGGVLEGCLTSSGFYSYGKKGPGKYVNLYVRDGHVLMEICGLRFDTGGTWNSTGPLWKPERRSLKGYVVRHPKGL